MKTELEQIYHLKSICKMLVEMLPKHTAECGVHRAHYSYGDKYCDCKMKKLKKRNSFILNMKSDIGSIVYSLIHDELKGKERMKLQRQLPCLIYNGTHNVELELNPGTYNQDGTLAEIPPVFEKEMNLNENLNCYWLKWIQKAFRKNKNRNTEQNELNERLNLYMMELKNTW